jgi:AcrR family transcriptional regulator
MSTSSRGDGAETTPDGRRLRAERSRARALDAIYAVLRDADLEVTTEQVAARAGVSLSTIRRHFGDLTNLSQAMRERILERVMPLLRLPLPSGSQAERLHELVSRRREIFEVLAPGLRAGMHRERGGAARALADRKQLESALRAHLLATFPAELNGAEGAARAELLSAVLSLGSWEHLRTVRELSPAECVELLERAALAILASHG